MKELPQGSNLVSGECYLQETGAHLFFAVPPHTHRAHIKWHPFISVGLTSILTVCHRHPISFQVSLIATSVPILSAPISFPTAVLLKALTRIPGENHPTCQDRAGGDDVCCDLGRVKLRHRKDDPHHITGMYHHAQLAGGSVFSRAGFHGFFTFLHILWAQRPALLLQTFCNEYMHSKETRR